MRPWIEVKEDLQALPEELAYWSNREKSPEVIQHPNCPIERWIQLFRYHPLEGFASPLYVLFMLENPRRWAEIERLYVSGWMSQMSGLLSWTKGQHWVCDCAQEVEPLYRTVCGDSLAQDVIDMRRELSLRNDSLYVSSDYLALMTKARTKAFNLYVAQPQEEYRRLRSAKMALLATYEEIPSCLSDAANASGYAVASGRTTDAFHEMRRWQWYRLLQYLRGDA